jgi:hypothetical protein
MVYKAMSYVTLPRICELSPHPYISCLKQRVVTLRNALVYNNMFRPYGSTIVIYDSLTFYIVLHVCS